MNKSKLSRDEMLYELYGMYQLDRMLLYGYNIVDILHAIDDDYRNGEKHADTVAIFEKLVNNGNGLFNGEIVCFDEFCDDEIYHEEYIKDLILKVCGDKQVELIKAYKEFLEA